MIFRHAVRFFIQPDYFWRRMMKAQYGAWSQESQIKDPHGCSFLRKEIRAHRLVVLAQVRWLIGDRISMVVSRDTWISSLPLSRWSTYISSEVDDHLHVCDLLNANGRDGKIQEITRLFDGLLADRILATPIFVHHSQDLRMWGRSCVPKVSLRDLSKMCRPMMVRRIDTA